MARDNKGPANDWQSLVERRLHDLENRLRRAENNTVSTDQQIDPNDIEDPIEGEHVIDHTDDQFTWYSGGLWHKSGKFIPHGIMRSTSLATPDPADNSYLDWNGDIQEDDLVPDGVMQTVSYGDWTGSAFSVDTAYPEVAYYMREPGIYIATIDVLFVKTDPGLPATASNMLEWNAGGYLGGHGHAEKVLVDMDISGAPTSYKGARQYISQMALCYVPSSVTPAPGNRFRAYADWGIDSIEVTATCWKIGEWA